MPNTQTAEKTMSLSEIIGEPIERYSGEDYNVTIVEPYAIPMPTIFSNTPPWCTIAYMGGGWLPMENVNQFTHYAYEIKYPLQALEIPEKRENITQGILKLTENPNKLFNNDRETLNADLDKLLQVKEKRLYRQWEKTIKNKTRVLSTPNPQLEHMLIKYVKDIILKKPAHAKARGGEPGWSPTKMIEAHMPFSSVLSCDIQQAFQSAESNFVFEFYYNLAREHFSETISKDTAGFLTTLSTVEYSKSGGHALPQGSPISMALFNRMLYPIDNLFEQVCKKNNMTYSRWVDDIIITSPIKHRNYWQITDILSLVREYHPMPVHKIFFQNKEPFYLLGQDIKNGSVTKSLDDTAKNARQPIIEPNDYNFDLF